MENSPHQNSINYLAKEYKETWGAPDEYCMAIGKQQLKRMIKQHINLAPPIPIRNVSRPRITFCD